MEYIYCFFFFQAEDGIRDVAVTGVQTCALPIWTETKIQSTSITGANLQLDTQSHIAGLSQLSDAVHEYGTKIFLQLTLGQGSYGPPELYPEGTLPNAVSETYSPLW